MRLIICLALLLISLTAKGKDVPLNWVLLMNNDVPAASKIREVKLSYSDVDESLNLNYIEGKMIISEEGSKKISEIPPSQKVEIVIIIYDPRFGLVKYTVDSIAHDLQQRFVLFKIIDKKGNGRKYEFRVRSNLTAFANE